MSVFVSQLKTISVLQYYNNYCAVVFTIPDSDELSSEEKPLLDSKEPSEPFSTEYKVRESSTYSYV